MTSQSAALPSGLPFAIDWLPEPVLGFAGGLTHIDPKVGIAAAGPRSLGDHRHPAVVTSAFIGTAELIETARKWLKQAAGGVDGDTEHHPFPGYQPTGPFRSSLRLDGPQRTLRRRDLVDLMGEDVWRWSGFDKLLGILDKHLHALARLDSPPALVFIALPADLVKRYESVHRRRAGVEIVRNLRASIKATAMRHGLRTQLLRQATIESSLTQHLGDLEHPADLAWNLFTAVYFKAGGFPWAPVGIPEGTCHVGVTFYRPHGERSAMRTSVAQAFAENGDAFVLRGNRFEWEGKWPHLPAEEAARLITDVLDRYADEMGRPARRVVVHKQSRFFDEEGAGFEEALRGVEYDLVALAPSTSVRVMRHGDYPPPRGACVTVGDRRYLYATGYLPSLGRYPHGHVPAPLQITDHVGDTPSGKLLDEVLLLTKMNWNSARFAEHTPVTVRFAGQVGEILRDLPDDYTPEHRYAFYM
jgi:hypothetical protein